MALNEKMEALKKKIAARKGVAPKQVVRTYEAIRIERLQDGKVIETRAASGTYTECQAAVAQGVAVFVREAR